MPHVDNIRTWDDEDVRDTFAAPRPGQPHVYIGRPATYGGVALRAPRPWMANPFKMKGVTDAERDGAVQNYRAFLWRRIRAGEIKLSELAALNDRTLVCWCAPKSCHGHVLANAASWAARQLRERN